MPPSSPDSADPADLSGHRALVTGAASGIGAAIAGRLVRSGAVVVAVDRDEAGLKDLAGRFDDGQVQQVPADLSDLDSIADLPTDIDILVNNAGLQHVSPIQEFPLAEGRRARHVPLRAGVRIRHRRVVRRRRRVDGAMRTTADRCTA